MIKSIIWFLMWPVFILLAYQFIRIMLRRFEKNLKTQETKETNL
jgi:hypothetical protein